MTSPQRPKRPRELQDSLNFHLYHPLAWRLAMLLSKTPLTPNVVSVIGACFVVGAGVVYVQGFLHSWGWPAALLGMLLHMTWHVVDGADGDLARITGRTSPLGELVDGVCDYTSHIILYFILGWLLSNQIGGIAWPVMLAAGVSHFVQANHCEVQRRQYQWWVYRVPWLRNTHSGETRTGSFGFSEIVSGYLNLASGMTPDALKVDVAVEAAAADPAASERIAAVARAEVLPLMPMLKVLGPNPRAILLGLSMLLGSPLYYFIYQTVVLNLLTAISVAKQNAAARRIAAKIAD
ncbi:MAG: CDP-alcohol phosphatidyltransferase family protein [Novosphingobium sp.]